MADVQRCPRKAGSVAGRVVSADPGAQDEQDAGEGLAVRERKRRGLGGGSRGSIRSQSAPDNSGFAMTIPPLRCAGEVTASGVPIRAHSATVLEPVGKVILNASIGQGYLLGHETDTDVYRDRFPGSIDR